MMLPVAATRQSWAGFLLLACVGLAACAREKTSETDVRGGGHPVVTATARSQAAAYEAAIRQEFEVDDALLLLADTAMLPRTDGLASGGPVSQTVLTTLSNARVVRGKCLPARTPTNAPTCSAPLPGYLVRFSEIFQLPGDTARLYLRFERFQRAGAMEQLRPLAFENGYDVVRSGSRWTVVRKAKRAMTRTGE